MEVTQLTEEERLKKTKALKNAFHRIHVKLEKSPCVYRGCELWFDCVYCSIDRVNHFYAYKENWENYIKIK